MDMFWVFLKLTAKNYVFPLGTLFFLHRNLVIIGEIRKCSQWGCGVVFKF